MTRESKREQVQAEAELDRLQTEAYSLDLQIETKTAQLRCTSDIATRSAIEAQIRGLQRARQSTILDLKRRQRELEPLLVNAILLEMKR